MATTITAPVSNLQQPRQEIPSLQTKQQHSNVVEQTKCIQTLQGQPSTTPQTNQNVGPHNIQSPTTHVANLYPSTLFTNDLQDNSDMATTYHNTETHQERLNYPLQQNTSQYQQELSSISPLNNRYSTTNESFQFPMQNQRVSEELRGQLPWSYTSMPPPIPKKPQMQVYPEIPTPDYGH